MPAASLVSVVIATRNRAPLVGLALDALAAQDLERDRFEVIVADNGSTDQTADVVAAFARRPDTCLVRYLHVAVAGKSRAVNAALGLAAGDIVAFTDDDVRPNRAWLSQVVRAFDDPAIDFVAGRILPDWEGDPPRWMSPALFGVLAIPDGGSERLRIERGLNEHVMPIGANMAIRACVLRRIGGLREDLGKLEGTLRTGEDHELFLRLLHHGCRGQYEPDAVVSHRVPRSRLHRAYFRGWFYQNGRDVARLHDGFPAGGRRLLGVPRYLWREAAANMWGVVRTAASRDGRRRLASLLRLIWLAGFVRETWFARNRLAPAGAAAPDARMTRVS